MLCDRCKTQSARIHMKGEGAFCVDCNNIRMEQMYGAKRLEHFAREIIVHDALKRAHRFTIENIMLPGSSEWTAVEGDDGYQFTVYAKPQEEPEMALARLHRKVIMGLQHQSLERADDRFFLSNALQTDAGQYTLRDTGYVRIAYDSQNGGTRLIIDGRHVPGSEFIKMLSQFESMNLNYQINDRSNGILEPGMVLIPYKIDAEAFITRFEECLSWFLDGSFLSYKRETACKSALSERLAEYDAFCQYADRKTAHEVGLVMISRLLDIDHDTDTFPDYLIELIRQSMPT